MKKISLLLTLCAAILTLSGCGLLKGGLLEVALNRDDHSLEHYTTDEIRNDLDEAIEYAMNAYSDSFRNVAYTIEGNTLTYKYYCAQWYPVDFEQKQEYFSTLSEDDWKEVLYWVPEDDLKGKTIQYAYFDYNGKHIGTYEYVFGETAKSSSSVPQSNSSEDQSDSNSLEFYVTDEVIDALNNNSTEIVQGSPETLSAVKWYIAGNTMIYEYYYLYECKSNEDTVQAAQRLQNLYEDVTEEDWKSMLWYVPEAYLKGKRVEIAHLDSNGTQIITFSHTFE